VLRDENCRKNCWISQMAPPITLATLLQDIELVPQHQDFDLQLLAI